MGDTDLGKVMNYFFIAFVIVVVVMMVFFSRLVSIMLAQRKNSSVTQTFAREQPHTSYLEDAHTMTVRLAQLANLQLVSGSSVSQERREVILTLAQGRKQAMLALMDENPEEVLATLFPEPLRDALPPEAQVFVEERTNVSGVIDIHPEEGANVHPTLVSQSGQRFILHTRSQDFQLPENGTRVLIEGIVLGNRVVVEAVRTME